MKLPGAERVDLLLDVFLDSSHFLREAHARPSPGENERVNLPRGVGGKLLPCGLVGEEEREACVSLTVPSRHAVAAVIPGPYDFDVVAASLTDVDVHGYPPLAPRARTRTRQDAS